MRPRRRPFEGAAGALALLLATILASGCSASESAGAATATAQGEATGDGTGAAKTEEAIPVEVESLALGLIEEVVRTSTNVEAERSAQVFAQASGIVVELAVEEGDVVKRGAVLLRLQDAEQRIQVDKAKSLLDNAEREFRRQESLFQQKLSAEQVYIDSQHQLEQAQIQLREAEQALSYTEVRAPIGGTVTARLVNVGERVNISQQLFDMVDFGTLVARVFVPERHMPRLSTGLTARVGSKALGEREHQGRVKLISPVVDPKTGTIKVTVDLAGERALRPGMYVDVALVVETRSDALLVPKRALVYDNDQVFAYRLGEGRRVSRILVNPVLSDRDHVVPATSLAAGDRVVIAGQAGLKDGALVRLPDDPDPASPDPPAAGSAS